MRLGDVSHIDDVDLDGNKDGHLPLDQGVQERQGAAQVNFAQWRTEDDTRVNRDHPGLPLTTIRMPFPHDPLCHYLGQPVRVAF